MKKAVLIFAHKAPLQINILVQQLLYDADDMTDVYIHIDLNHNDIGRDLLTNDHVVLIKKNVPIIWGNDSMVKAMLISFSQIIGTGIDYDYFVICTGQDLLVRKHFDEFLFKNEGKIYLDFYKDDHMMAKLERGVPDFLCRYYKEKYHPLRMMRGVYLRACQNGVVPRRKIRFDYSSTTFYHSFNWSAMPFEVLEYIVTFVNDNPGFLDLYYHTYLPEDGFLGTVIMNSKYRDQVKIKADGTSETIMYHPELIDAHCQFLTINNVKEIEKSGCYFARKFDIATDRVVVNYYLEMIKGKNA